nr:prolyl oligopeptidase family serine peptidase [uncultured Steroidobacter sp.]
MALPALSVAAAPQPFTVDLMVKAEGLGEVMFTPDGDRLLLEKLAAYENSQSFGWSPTWGRDRATLLSVDSSGIRSVSPEQEERVWFASYSPSGSKAAVGWFDGDVAKAGVYDLRSGELKKFDFLVSNVGYCVVNCPHWLSEDEFIHMTLSAEAQRRNLSSIQYTDEITRRWAIDSWNGKQPSAKVLGSGAYQSKGAEEGDILLRVNARTGETVELGRGVVRGLSLSPDRRRLAVLRETGALNVAGLQLKSVSNVAKVLELVVYDLAAADAEIFPCKSCNVTSGSLRWSPGGSKLFFGSRHPKDGKLAHEHHIYDFRRARLERFAPRGLAFDTEENVQRFVHVVPFAWLTEDTPAVRVTKQQASAGAKTEYEWFAVPPRRAPVSLTAGLKSEQENSFADHLAAYRGDLFMMVDGDLWKLSADGSRKNLTEDVPETLQPWCPAPGYARDMNARFECRGGVAGPGDRKARAEGWLTFTPVENGVPTEDVWFLNVASGEKARIAAPHEDAQLVTTSALAKVAVYNRKAADGDRVLLVTSTGTKRQLLHFNRHLEGVVGGKPVMLTRREQGENEDRYDWLLLPPGHQPGDRHPLLVYFYPDTSYSKEWPTDDLRTVRFLNQHLPAARGFAVLFASMKISSVAERGNPMTEMHEQLIHAAENAAQAGYADPERWALMGHSYGGYGTASVITQTDRFKAAIAMAGTYNLTSGYAAGLSVSRATDAGTGLSFGAQWAEGGQGRMGVAPWQDPQRYIDNSPLFHAHKIDTPLLLIHGDYDFVNVNEAEQMFNALQRQGKDAQFVRYWGEGHTILSPANIRDMWDRIFLWLDQHLGTGT